MAETQNRNIKEFLHDIRGSPNTAILITGYPLEFNLDDSKEENVQHVSIFRNCNFTDVAEYKKRHTL